MKILLITCGNKKRLIEHTDNYQGLFLSRNSEMYWFVLAFSV